MLIAEVPTVSLAQLPALPYGELLKLPEVMRRLPTIRAAIRRGEQQLKLLQSRLKNVRALAVAAYGSCNSNAMFAHSRSELTVLDEIRDMGVSI